MGEIFEISVVADSEAAEVVSELFNRYNGGGYSEDSRAGEASGGGAVIEATGFDDLGRPIDGEYQIVVKTFIKPGARGAEIRRKIEEGLWHLSLLYPIPEPQIRVLKEEDWAHAWKKHYRPMRVGQRIVLKPSWEEYEPDKNDIVVELDPGMAFGTGLHPSTRLSIAALEEIVQIGDTVLDIGTGSGVLSVIAAKLGAGSVVATDIDPVAIHVARENVIRNGLVLGLSPGEIAVSLGSVPDDRVGQFRVVVANILAEVLVGLFDSQYDNPPLATVLAPDGHMILAGIIEEKAGTVVDAAIRHGLTLVRKKQESDWVALVVHKPRMADSPRNP